MNILKIATKPFAGQQPGTSGLRKKVTTFQQPHYLANFIQAIFHTISVKGQSLILGGDGRYFNTQAIQIIIKMAAANAVKHLYIGQNGFLSTPAASLLIRQYQAIAGIILSASHNIGGEEGDFGIKVNTQHGGPASESISAGFYARSQKLDHYHILDVADINLSQPGHFKIGTMCISIVDSVQDYTQNMMQLFDFDRIHDWLKNHHLCFDAMHAISGPYAQRIFEDILGAKKGSVINATPKIDFAGQAPDPNPIHTPELIKTMFSHKAPDLGAASDGDGDRNMIVGQSILVNPSDSLAILTAQAQNVPGYTSLKGVARSMPTSRAVDCVAQHFGLPIYETPTGWKFFSNLLESGCISLCGEESYGTSSDHSREKDGIWAVLFWLNILAIQQKSVAQIMQAHWTQFGRHYSSRHDFDAIPLTIAQEIIAKLRKRIHTLSDTYLPNFISADDFEYTDPIDGTVSIQQGIRILLHGARIIYRLSGTSTKDATLRIYLEYYVSDSFQLTHSTQTVLANLAHTAYQLADLQSFIHPLAPTTIV